MLSLLIPAVLLAAGPPATPAETAAEARHLKNIRQVTSGFSKAGEGYFRPDGKAIIFQAADRPGEDDYQIYTLDLAPGAKPVLVSTGKGKCTCSYYHPDGKSILFASTHLDPALAKGDKPDPKAAKGPAYSRSERYRWDFDPAMDIFRADPDGSNLVRLTDAPGYDAEGSYSPDGKQIIFTSFRDGNAEIYIMDADGEPPEADHRQEGVRRRAVLLARRQEDHLPERPQGERPPPDLHQHPRGDAERALTDQRGRQLGAVLPPRQPPHRLLDEPARPPELRDLPDGHRDGQAGADHRREGFDGLPVFSPDGKKMMWTSKGRTADDTSQLFIADFVLDPDSTASR